jgi:phosphoserine phosphatase RsbU/P
MSVRVRVQSPHSAASEYELDDPEIVIGRAPTSSIVVADSRVSRQHARIVRRGDGWWVEDLGARNRTLLNGSAVEGSAKLTAGDNLAIGDSIVNFLGDGRQPVPIGASETRPVDPGRPTIVVDRTTDAARMRTINEIHRALAAPLSLAELLEVILARCFDVLNPEEGVVMLQRGDGTLSVAASRTVLGGNAPVTVPRRLVDEVVAKQRPAVVLDAAFDERFAGSQSIVASGMRSVLAAPLADAEGALGLIALFSRVAIRSFTQADLDMLVSIAGAAALRVRNVALADELVKRRLVEHELELAHDVQMSMLPRQLPQRPELEIAARLEPARSVGGDLYDFVLDGDRLWFIVADVAGKSIAAALYMAMTKTLFRATARHAADASEVAKRMNEELARENDACIFVTAAVGSLNLISGELELVDAGHNPVLVVNPDADAAAIDPPKCMALGIDPDAVYSPLQVTLGAGSMLVLYTDGVTETTNESRELFGEGRLSDAVTDARSAAPAAFVSHIFSAVERFGGGAPPDDDRTLLVVRYRGPIQSAV